MLFLIFVRDFVELIMSGELYLFVDDIIIYIISENIDDIIYIL